MLVFDKNIFGSKRSKDANGYLRCEDCNITKTQVAPYLSNEIPNWKEFGLEPGKIYYVLRPEAELKKAVETFNNLPLTRKHIEVDVDNVPKEDIIGSLGDSAVFEDGYLKNNLIVYDQKYIDRIENGKQKELSCGYRYTPVRESGEYNGQHYDFVMKDIIGNHVALVKEGRAGHDVMVSDTIETVKDKIMGLFGKKQIVGDEFKESEHPRDKDGKFTNSSENKYSVFRLRGDIVDIPFIAKIGSKDYEDAKKQGLEEIGGAKTKEDAYKLHKKYEEDFFVEGNKKLKEKEEKEQSQKIKTKIFKKKDEDGKEFFELRDEDGNLLSKSENYFSLKKEQDENPTYDAKLSEKQQEKVGIVMKEFKEGELKSGSGEKVTNPAQAKAIALSEAKQAKDKDIPDELDKPDTAGEVKADKEDKKMDKKEKKESVAEVKEEKIVEDKAVDKRKLIDEIGGILKGKVDDELIRTIIGKAEQIAYNGSEAGKADDAEIKTKEQKEDFAEGVAYGEKKEKEEPKKLDSEHESEGMKKKEAEDKCAKDGCGKMAKDEMTFDIDSIKAQVREEVMEDFKAREEARKSVKSTLGEINVMAFDSCEDIYKLACEKAGLNLDEIASYKDAFKGFSAGKALKGGLALDATPKSSGNEECFKNIRV